MQFCVSADDWSAVEKKLGKLTHWCAWRLARSTGRDHDDVYADLICAMHAATLYMIRQRWVLAAMEAAGRHVHTEAERAALAGITAAWAARRSHGNGNGRKVFTEAHIVALGDLIAECVPAAERPDPAAPLTLDASVVGYIKSVIHNEVKTLGKRDQRRIKAVSLTNLIL